MNGNFRIKIISLAVSACGALCSVVDIANSGKHDSIWNGEVSFSTSKVLALLAGEYYKRVARMGGDIYAGARNQALALAFMYYLTSRYGGGYGSVEFDKAIAEGVLAANIAADVKSESFRKYVSGSNMSLFGFEATPLAKLCERRRNTGGLVFADENWNRLSDEFSSFLQHPAESVGAAISSAECGMVARYHTVKRFWRRYAEMACSSIGDKGKPLAACTDAYEDVGAAVAVIFSCYKSYGVVPVLDLRANVGARGLSILERLLVIYHAVKVESSAMESLGLPRIDWAWRLELIAFCLHERVL